MTGTRREDSCTDDSEKQVMNVYGNGIYLLGYINGNLRHLVGRARPIHLLGRDLYLIYFSVMCNLEVCVLVFDHNTLGDIAIWALPRWVSGSRHFAKCLYREPVESCPRPSILFL